MFDFRLASAIQMQINAIDTDIEKITWICERLAGYHKEAYTISENVKTDISAGTNEEQWSGKQQQKFQETFAQVTKDFTLFQDTIRRQTSSLQEWIAYLQQERARLIAMLEQLKEDLQKQNK